VTEVGALYGHLIRSWLGVVWACTRGSAARAGTAQRVWSTCYGAVTLSGRGARVYTCTCVHDNILCTHLPK